MSIRAKRLTLLALKFLTAMIILFIAEALIPAAKDLWGLIETIMPFIALYQVGTVMDETEEQSK